MSRFRPRPSKLLAVLAVVAVGAACGGGSGSSGSSDRGSITVGAKLDPEAQLLGQLMAKTLEAKGYTVKTKIPTGNTDITRRALTSGSIDIYWEFTSSGLAILKQDPIGDPGQAYDKARQLDAKNGITWLPSASMNDTYALAVAANGPVKAQSLSDLASAGTSGLTLCADPEGGFRTDVLPLVTKTYGITFTKVTQIGADLVPQSVAQGKCQVGIVYSTSFLIPKNNLRVLADDKRAFGAYTPAPTIKASRLKDFPKLQSDLAKLTKALDTATITELNAKAGGDAKKVAQVADDFLKSKGITG
ncbi:MAG: hypothetical protein HYX34_00790 [Actinobacteria bacterium]|nr:hypothetical protein [Actinomycetota bacterium]